MDWLWNKSAALSKQRIWIARGLAAAADVVQIGLFPMFVEGAFSPVDDMLDAVMCLVLTLLIGWHIAFLPSFLVKLTPFADMAPTWTIAVFIATTGRAKPVSETETALPSGKIPPTLPPLDAK